jgi:hypothetical protein
MNGYLLKKSIYGEFMGFDQRKFAGFCDVLCELVSALP